MSIYDKLRRQKELEEKYKNKSKQDIIVEMVKSEYQIRTDSVQDYGDLQYDYENKLAALEDKIDNLNEQLEEEKREKNYYKQKKILEYLVDNYTGLVMGVAIFVFYILYTTFSFSEWSIDPYMNDKRASVSKGAIYNNPLKYCESSFWGLKKDCYTAWYDDGRWYYWDFNRKMEVNIWWDL